MNDLNYMLRVKDDVYNMVENDERYKGLWALHVRVKRYETDDKLLVKYSRDHARYSANEIIEDQTSLDMMEMVKAKVQANHSVIATLTQDETAIYVVVVKNSFCDHQ